MDTVDLDIRRPWLLRVFGRNPLVRSSDRLEAVVAVLVGMIVVLMVPVAGAVGTGVHEKQVAHLEEAMAGRHQVAAVVTADSTVLSDPFSAGSATSVRWTVGGQTHEEVVHSREWRTAGEAMTLWVDDRGVRTVPPPGPADAAANAVVAAFTVWTGMTAVAVGLFVLARTWLNRRRYARWDRDYERLDDDGGTRRHTW